MCVADSPFIMFYAWDLRFDVCNFAAGAIRRQKG